MRFTLAAAALAGVASAQSWGQWPASNGTVSYTTEVVTAYTTYCSNTVITHGSATYAVSTATTLTITDCPCTVVRPVMTSVVTSCSTPAPYKPTGTAPPVKPATGSGVVPPATMATPAPTSSPITPAKGAADKVSVGVAGLLAVAGLVAAL